MEKRQKNEDQSAQCQTNDGDMVQWRDDDSDNNKWWSASETATTSVGAEWSADSDGGVQR